MANPASRMRREGEEMDVTIFEQDGKVYTALSHTLPTKELAKQTAIEIRNMAKVPRARMKVVSKEEFLKMPFEAPIITHPREMSSEG